MLKGEKIKIEEEINITDTATDVSRRGKVVRVVFIVIFIFSLIGNIYSWNKINVLQQDPAEINRKEIQDVVARVSKLMVLPSDEIPTLATVSDPEKLKNQAFFNNAQIGDKVLVYSKAQKAILYNPSENKIVEVAPIGTNSSGTSVPITEPVKKK